MEIRKKYGENVGKLAKIKVGIFSIQINNHKLLNLNLKMFQLDSVGKLF